jgi:hypothetical protein
VKSAALSSVSASELARATEAELLAPAAAPPPSCTSAVPKPTRSLTRGSAAQSAAVRQVSGSAPVTRATVPLVPDMLIAPVASGAGSGVLPPVPAASWTR